MMKYHDALLKDMKENHRRKGANLLAEAFAPYSAEDYQSLFRQPASQPVSQPDGQGLALV